MKMKCKFFGATAKLAMAILAVGAMFTSCYDSENGDVTKPYHAPDPVYTISGTITDVETGEALDQAKVTVNGESVTLSDGVYSTNKGKEGENTVTVSMTGYNDDQTITRKFTIAKLENGQASTTVVNVALKKNVEEPDPEFDIEKVEMDITSTSKDVLKVFTPEEYIGLSLAASEEPLFFDRTFAGIEIGAEVEPTIEEALKDAPKRLVNYAKATIGAYEGLFGEKRTIDAVYTVPVPPYQTVKSVTITYNVVKTEYAFSYDGKEYPWSR